MAHGDITHLEIPVSDMRRSAEFYTALFGWEINELPGFEGYPMWQAPNKVSGGALTPRDEAFTQPRAIVEVDSIDGALTRVQSGGGIVVIKKTEITPTSWFAVFEDPDGNSVGLFEGTMEG